LPLSEQLELEDANVRKCLARAADWIG